MAFLFLFFTVALSLCVVGLIVLALSSILASVRDNWRLKKPEREPIPSQPSRHHHRQRKHQEAQNSSLLPESKPRGSRPSQ
jgi:hypothetical protein